MTKRTPTSVQRIGRLAIAAGLIAAACSSTTDTPSATSSVGSDAVETTATTEIRPDPGENPSEPTGDAAEVVRGDLTIEGNRVLDGRGRIDAVEPVDVDLPGTPERIMPLAGEPRFVVVLEDGSMLLVDTDGVATAAPTVEAADPQPDVDFDDPLPDGRVVSNGEVAVALVGPTDRYPHGVLGDRIEAAAVQVIDLTTGDRVRFGPEPPTVIEGIQPMLVDVDGDGIDEVLVTESNAEVGAALAVWSLDGEVLARSVAIGQGNRWRNQLAVAPIGPGGEIEIIDVRTPHLGGTLQFFRVDGDELERVAFITGYTSHRIGSRNLDLGIVADADGDGRLDVVLPNDRRTELGVVTRVDSGEAEEAGAETVATVELPGQLTTNVAAVAVGEDLWFAVGTEDDVLRIWPGG